MRALVYEQFGEPAEVLKLRDVPDPQPGPGEVRVRMLASPINPSDLMTVRGIYGKQPKLPATPGFEGVGVIESSGGGLLGKLLAGKRVAALNPKGGNWGELAVIPARQAVPLSSRLPVEQAAMFFVNPATAYAMTRLILRVPKQAWLLQTAAGSAVGRMIIRLGKRYGFRTLNVVRRAEQIDELKTLGADAVVHFDAAAHDPEHLEQQVDRIAAPKGIRYAVDPVGGATGSAVVHCLRSGGRLLVYGTLTEDPLIFSPRVLIAAGGSVQGFWLGRWMERISLREKVQLMRSISRLMRQGILVSQVAAQYRLDEIAEAVHAAESDGRTGKVLLRIADE